MTLGNDIFFCLFYNFSFLALTLSAYLLFILCPLHLSFGNSKCICICMHALSGVYWQNFFFCIFAVGNKSSIF